jgi:alpha-tubulin suppressor-like RCC1 family protein
VNGITVATAISVGLHHTCALLFDTVKCWGRNNVGQLGDGTTVDSSSPVPVIGIKNVKMISVAEFHSCALLLNRTVKCWGLNSGRSPVSINGITDAAAISVGDLFACALLSDGAVKCWGDNKQGQLGDGTTSNPSIVSTAETRPCASLSDRPVKCYSQLTPK